MSNLRMTKNSHFEQKFFFSIMGRELIWAVPERCYHCLADVFPARYKMCSCSKVQCQKVGKWTKLVAGVLQNSKNCTTDLFRSPVDRFTKNFFWNFKMCIANSMENYHSGQLAKKIPQMSLLHKVQAKNGQKMVKKGQK